MKSFLKLTDQLHELPVKTDGFNEMMVMTHQKWVELVKVGGILYK
jgi:hypothetical protein